MSFDGKVAFITGSGSGIGVKVAKLLAARGASVMVTDLDEAAAQTVARDIKMAGGAASSRQLDVTDMSSVMEAVQATEAEFGGLDCCVNNAGVATQKMEIGEISAEEWGRQIAVNLTGVFHCLQAEVRVMRDSQRGSIVNLASILGVVGMQNRAAYAAAKHGVVGLTKSAALDYATRGIRINAIAPGYVDTPLLAGRSEQERSDIADLHPMRRMAHAEEIAEAALFLLSDRAGFITGTVLGVDGGYTAR